MWAPQTLALVLVLVPSRRGITHPFNTGCLPLNYSGNPGGTCTSCACFKARGLKNHAPYGQTQLTNHAIKHMLNTDLLYSLARPRLREPHVQGLV